MDDAPPTTPLTPPPSHPQPHSPSLYSHSPTLTHPLPVPPIVLLKRKLCVAAVFCGILFPLIATHPIQRNNILSLPRPLGLADSPASSSPTPAVRGPDGGKRTQPLSLPSPGPSQVL